MISTFKNCKFIIFQCRGEVVEVISFQFQFKSLSTTLCISFYPTPPCHCSIKFQSTFWLLSCIRNEFLHCKSPKSLTLKELSHFGRSSMNLCKEFGQNANMTRWHQRQGRFLLLAGNSISCTHPLDIPGTVAERLQSHKIAKGRIEKTKRLL